MRPGEKEDTSKALISYQPQEEDFSSPFLHLLQREGHHNLQRSANPLLPANGACLLLALKGCCSSSCSGHHSIALRMQRIHPNTFHMRLLPSSPQP